MLANQSNPGPALTRRELIEHFFAGELVARDERTTRARGNRSGETRTYVLRRCGGMVGFIANTTLVTGGQGSQYGNTFTYFEAESAAREFCDKFLGLARA